MCHSTCHQLSLWRWHWGTWRLPTWRWQQGGYPRHASVISRGAKCKIAFSAKSQGPEAVSDNKSPKYSSSNWKLSPVWTCRYLTNQFSSRASYICFAQKKGNTHFCADLHWLQRRQKQCNSAPAIVEMATRKMSKTRIELDKDMEIVFQPSHLSWVSKLLVTA